MTSFSSLQSKQQQRFMAVLQHRSRLLLPLLLAALVCRSNARRPLITAHERERIPDTYFVHMRHDVSPEKIQEIVQKLSERSNRDDENFRATVASIVTRAAYGFSARLSTKALNYVSCAWLVAAAALLHLILYIVHLCKSAPQSQHTDIMS